MPTRPHVMDEAASAAGRSLDALEEFRAQLANASRRDGSVPAPEVDGALAIRSVLAARHAVSPGRCAVLAAARAVLAARHTVLARWEAVLAGAARVRRR